MKSDKSATKVALRFKTAAFGEDAGAVVEQDPVQGSVQGNVPPSDGAKKRNIPKDHPYDAKAIKPMAKALWALSVSLGHALTGYRHMSRLKSTTVSPDGMLGGRGYVMTVKDARQQLHAACDSLSSIADTLYDELQAPHWKPKLALLDANEAGDIAKFIEEAQANLADPEEDVEQEIVKIEQENDGGEEPDAELSDDEEPPFEEDEEESAEVEPESDDTEEPEEAAVEEDSEETEDSEAVETEEPEEASEPEPEAKGKRKPPKPKKKLASSIPVDSLSGPRVERLGPAESPWAYGAWNPEEDYVDGWKEGPRDPDYQVWASSVMPNEYTPTDANDFGLGFGARGEGLEKAHPTSDGKGVDGPHSGLPDANAVPSEADLRSVDVALNDRKALLRSLLPNDNEPPVARSDYYDGDKGNTVNAWDPHGESALPGEAEALVDHPQDLVDTYYMHEDLAQPIVRYERFDSREGLENG